MEIKDRPHSGSWQLILAEHYSQIRLCSEIIVDLLAVSIGLTTGFGFYSFLSTVQPDWFHSIKIVSVSTFVAFLVFERLGLYRYQASLMNLIEIRKIIRAVFVLFVALLLYSFFGETHYPPMMFVSASALMLLFVLVARMCLFKLQQMLHLKGINVRRTLIWGAGEEGRLLCQNIRQAPKLGYLVVGFLDEDEEQLEIARDWFEGSQNGVHFSADVASFLNIVQKLSVDEVLLCTSLHQQGGRSFYHLVENCRKAGVKFSFAPFIRGYYVNQVKITDINGIPMVTLGQITLSRSELISKRVFDLVFALLSLMVLWPVFLLISYLIRRDSDGPIFFKQERVGKDGELFSMFKFRTMFTDCPKYGNSPTSPDDPRITRIGKYLRRTSLDELPQILNVIRGEMSLVGPRPEMPFIVENEYNEICRQRLRVKPGITGVWQISADRVREIHENISYDIFYLENRSLLLDIVIIIRTLIFAVSAMRTN